MTVASRPMWSPATRSIPCAAAETPRMMLPPPTTTAISTPEPVDVADLVGHARDDLRGDAELLVAHQRLSEASGGCACAAGPLVLIRLLGSIPAPGRLSARLFGGRAALRAAAEVLPAKRTKRQVQRASLPPRSTMTCPTVFSGSSNA